MNLYIYFLYTEKKYGRVWLSIWLFRDIQNRVRRQNCYRCSIILKLERFKLRTFAVGCTWHHRGCRSLQTVSKQCHDIFQDYWKHGTALTKFVICTPETENISTTYLFFFRCVWNEHCFSFKRIFKDLKKQQVHSQNLTLMQVHAIRTSKKLHKSAIMQEILQGQYLYSH